MHARLLSLKAGDLLGSDSKATFSPGICFVQLATITFWLQKENIEQSHGEAAFLFYR
jgi:hypothetical protein